MRLSNNVIEMITRKNFEMLFAKDEFDITFETKCEDESCQVIIMHIEPTTDPNDPTVVSWCSVDIELQNWKKLPSFTYKHVSATKILTYFCDERLEDLVKCIRHTVDKIEEITALNRPTFYTDEECLVIGFSEIGIDHPDGSRDIIVNRDGVYSFISFDNDENRPETFPITEDKIREMIYQANDPVNKSVLEFIGSETIMFVDLDEYE